MVISQVDPQPELPAVDTHTQAHSRADSSRIVLARSVRALHLLQHRASNCHHTHSHTHSHSLTYAWAGVGARRWLDTRSASFPFAYSSAQLTRTPFRSHIT